jgi:glycosyltransferase involved in cell wall biosynthesis
MSLETPDISPIPGRRVAVIITAYNEAARIEATLEGLTATFPGAPVWVADDGSTDATASLARRTGARVVRSERMIGKGAAATLVAREVLEDVAQNAANAHAHVHARIRNRKSNAIPDGDGDSAVAEDEPIFVLCDGDLGASAGKLGALVDAVESGEADIAVAAFAARVGGGVGIAVGFARWAIRRRCGLELRAPISGQRALRARVLEDVLPFAPGFGMEIGMTIDAARAGHRIAEVELDLDHRATGRTLSGFLHRGRQLVDFVRVYAVRR